MSLTPLVFLPGLLCDEALWAHQTAHLGDVADPQVARLTGQDSVGGMARAVLDTAPERFALVGLSMGGYVAQEIMRQAPERVIKLALLDTSARADTEEQLAKRKGLIALAKTGKFKGVTPKLLPLLLSPEHLENEAMCDAVMQMAERVGREAFVLQQTAIMTRPDGRESLSCITCPTLVVVGREDALTPPELATEMANSIRGAELAIIEQSGHLPPIEQPQATTALLRLWLTR